jgi:hypothetical protein
MKIIKAKRPFYRDIIFRSELEARWAVFFDYLNVQYKYEPEFDEVECDGRRILHKPDFFLVDLCLWIEVKSKILEQLDDSEIRKIVGWGKYEGILILSGPPRILDGKSDPHYLCTWNPIKNRVNHAQRQIWWCECPKCRRIDVRPCGGVPLNCEKTCYAKPYYDVFGEELDVPDGHRSKRLREACRTAKNFVFGS